MTETILLTGGAGYVGAATMRELQRRGHRIAVLDNLLTGHLDGIPVGVELLRYSYGDAVQVGKILRRIRPTAVIHTAARSIVSESVADPDGYRQANVTDSLVLLESMLEAGVNRLVFSSSAAVYGDPLLPAISEETPLRPVNPYGETKAAFESALLRAGGRGLRAIALRYFNVAGAVPGVAERHEPETHLLPRLWAAAMSGSEVAIFGEDYPTPDGTALRDYVHLADVARANVAAVERLIRGRIDAPFSVANIGSGRGTSIREAISAIENASGRSINAVVHPRRDGDPASLVARIARAETLLDWSPERSTIIEIADSLRRPL